MKSLFQPQVRVRKGVPPVSDRPHMLFCFTIQSREDQVEAVQAIHDVKLGKKRLSQSKPARHVVDPKERQLHFVWLWGWLRVVGHVLGGEARTTKAGKTGAS